MDDKSNVTVFYRLNATGRNDNLIPMTTPWAAIQASRYACMASGQDSCSAPCSYDNGGRVVPPGTIAVFLQDIPGEKRGLLIVLRTKAIKFQELCRPSLGALSRFISGHSYKSGDCICVIQCISPLYACFECVTTIVCEEMLSLSLTFGYRWHRLTGTFCTGFSICSRGPAAADSLQWFAAAGNKLIM